MVVRGTARDGAVLVAAASRGGGGRIATLLLARRYDVRGPYAVGAARLAAERDALCAVVDLTRRDRRRSPPYGRLVPIASSSVVAVTDRNDVRARTAMIAYGVVRHVVAPIAEDELIAHVQHILATAARSRRQAPIHVGDLTIRPAEQCVERNGIEVPLTTREFAVLLALSRRAGRVVAKQTLMNDVWRETVDNANNVEVHVSALRRKLEPTGRPLIHTVRGSGYLLSSTSRHEALSDSASRRIHDARRRSHR